MKRFFDLYLGILAAVVRAWQPYFPHAEVPQHAHRYPSGGHPPEVVDRLLGSAGLVKMKMDMHNYIILYIVEAK